MYRIKKVASLVADAYLPEKKADEAEEPVYIDGNYKNVAASNLTRRKLRYLPSNLKEKPFSMPEEDVYPCNFNDIYITKNAKVYKLGKNGYAQIKVGKLVNKNGNVTDIIRYYDKTRDKYEVIVLRKLMAYAFLGYDGTGSVINAENKYDNNAIENIYIKPRGTKMFFLDHPAVEIYSDIPEDCVEYKDLFLNRNMNVYHKKGDMYVKLVKYIIKEKGKKIFVGCRYIDDDNKIHNIEITSAFEEIFGERFCFNKEKTECYLVKKKNSYRKKCREEYVQEIGSDYFTSPKNENLWINRAGDVYEYVSGKGYVRLKRITEKKHGHPYVYVNYAQNYKGIYRHKGIDRLLAETFLWKEDTKCPHIIHKDGDYLNNDLDNLALAGEEKRIKIAQMQERKRMALENKLTAKTDRTGAKSVAAPLKKSKSYAEKKHKDIENYKYEQTLPETFKPIPGATYKDYYINPEGEVYKYDEEKGYRKIEICTKENGVAYIKLNNMDKEVGLLLTKAFVPNPSNAINWEPINGNKKDISLSNIRWKSNCCVVESIPATAHKTYEDNIWVDLDGTIYYEEEGVCKKVLKYTTTGERYVVQICKKMYYPSRLIAEALISNLYGKDGRVAFINGNTLDIRLENLKWVKRDELLKHNGKHVRYCQECGKIRVYKEYQYCAKCLKSIKTKDKLSAEAATMRQIPQLTQAQLELIDLYEKKGNKYTEIASILGISRQAVHQRIEILRKKAARTTDTNIVDEDKLKTEARAKYKKLNPNISFEKYEEIYRLAAKAESSAAVIAKRVAKRIENGLDLGKSIEELVSFEDQYLTYQRLAKNK